MYGYHNRYLRIDLARTSAAWAPIGEEVLLRHVGGVGLGTWLLHCETAARQDPLDRRAAFVLATSPLVGTPLTTSAKFAVLGKSPLTGRLNDSLSSSQFAIAAKRTGADAIVVTEQCAQWSVLVIDDGEVSVLPAKDLQGTSAARCQAMIRERIGNDFAVLAIGVAGERQVPYATVSHENRHAGRGGMGALLGAKRLKAIAVRGRQRAALADSDSVVRIARELSARSFGPATVKYRELGTVANLLTFNRLAVLPTRNFQQSTFESADLISGENLALTRGKVRDSCAACTIGCEHIFPIDDGAVRLEYETLFALGSLCGIDDRETILRAARLCDSYGLDTISFGGTFSFACECVERGLLESPKDLDLRFGSREGILAAIAQVAEGRGTGRLLALGSRRLAEHVGRGALEFAPQVKGLEIPGYDPAMMPMTALGFAVGTRGADHNRSGAYEIDFADGRRDRDIDAADVARVIFAEDRSALFDSLILCKFLRGVFSDVFEAAAEMLAAVTGVRRTATELRQCAAEIVLLKRRYNEREGWTRSEDTLPARFVGKSSGDWAIRQTVLTPDRLSRLVSEYYEARGLAPDGSVPANSTS